LRKLTIELKPKFENIPGKLFEKIESIKLLELLKIDFEKYYIVGIFEIILKNGYIIEDLILPREVEIFNLLHNHENNYICFVKMLYPDKKSRKKLKEFDLDIIWTKIDIFPYNKIIIGIIGENKQLNKFIEIIKSYGNIKIVSYSNAVFEKHHILSSLTNKQREIILAAKNNGYYEYPRAINVNQLSEKMGISKSTTIEHLRKAEKRLISKILIGY
jgi:hypothetical protein